MPVTDEIARLVRASRDRTVAATDQQVVALTTAWVEAWDALAPEFDAALAALLADTDGTIPASRVAKDRRITQALARARATRSSAPGLPCSSNAAASRGRMVS